MDNQVIVALIENPFETDVSKYQKPVDCTGQSVFSYVASSIGLAPEEISIYYGSMAKTVSKVLEPDEYNTVIPIPGDCIIAMSVVANGGASAKKTLGAIAAIGLSLLSFGVGEAIAAGSKWGFWSYAGAAATQVVGGAIISHFMSQPENDPKHNYAFGALQNRSGERNPIPLLYGENRYAGQIISKYVSTDGNKSFYNVLMCGGYGSVDHVGNGEMNDGAVDNVPGIGDIQINGQSISNYTGIKVWKRAGLNNQSMIPNFGDQIAQQFFSHTIAGHQDGFKAYTVTTDGETGQGLQVVFDFPEGLCDIHRDGDDPDAQTITIKIEYKLHDATEWALWKNASYRENSQIAFKKTERIDSLPAGKYDVRCQVVGLEHGAALDKFECVWSILGHITYEDLAFPNMALLGIQALATDLLSGSEPNITAIWKRSTGWVWNPDTGQYLEKSMTNPAWAAYDMIHQIRRYWDINNNEWVFETEGARISRNNYQAFSDWADFCDDKGLVCNYVHDQAKSLRDSLKPFEDVGRGRVFIEGTKFGCVCDRPVDYPTQMFVASNTELNSYSKEITSRTGRATSIEVTFRNKDNEYEPETITVPGPGYDDPDVEDNPISVTLDACTSYEQAYREGHYRLLVNHFITETINHVANIDAIQCKIGDVYAFCRNKINGSRGGRVIEVTANTVELDQEITLDPEKNYAIRVRLSNDSQIERTIVNNGEKTIILTVAEPFEIDRIDAEYVDATRFRVVGNLIGTFYPGRTLEMDHNYRSVVILPVISSSYGNGYTTVIMQAVPQSIYQVRWGYTMPATGDIYAFGETDKVVELYRMWAVSRDSNQRRTIVGIKYVPEVYNELADIPVYDPPVISRSFSIKVSHHYDKVGIAWLDVSWTPPQYQYGGARIYVDGSLVGTVDMHETDFSYVAKNDVEHVIRVEILDAFKNSYAVGASTYIIPAFAIDPDIVTGLMANWDAPDLKVFWDATTMNTDGITVVDIKDYQVDVIIGGVVKRTENIQVNLYSYSYEKNISDNGQPVSSVTVTVKVRDRNDRLSESQEIVCIARTPNAPVLQIAAEVARNSVTVAIAQLDLISFERVEIMAKQSAGASSGGTVIYSGPSCYYAHNVGTNEKWYYQARIYSKVGKVSAWSAEISQTTKQVEVATMNPQIFMAKTSVYTNADGSGMVAITSGALGNIHDGAAGTGAALAGAGYIEDAFVGQQYFSTLRLNVSAAVQLYAQRYDDTTESWVDCLGSASTKKDAVAGQNIYQISPYAISTKMRIYLAGAATVNELRFGTVGQADDFYFERMTGDQIDVNTITIGAENLASGTVQNVMPLSDDVIVHFDNSLVSTRGLAPNSGHDGVLVPSAGKYGGALKVTNGISYNVGQRNPISVAVKAAFAATFSRNSDAYLPDGSKVSANQPRFKSIYGTQLVDGTENLMRLDIAPDAHNAAGSDCTVEPYVYNGIAGYRVRKTVTAGWGSYIGWAIKGNAIPDKNAKYSFSIFAINLDISKPFGIGAYFTSTGSTNHAFSAGNKLLTDTYQRYTWDNIAILSTYDPTALDTTYHLTTNVASCDYFIAMPQLEKKDHCTDFVQGVRKAVYETIATGLFLEEWTANYITDPDMESGVIGTYAIPGTGAATGTTLVNQNQEVLFGNYSLKLTKGSDVSLPNMSHYYGVNKTTTLGVSGKTITARAFIKTNRPGVGVRIQLQRSGGNYQVIFSDIIIGTGEIQEIFMTGTFDTTDDNNCYSRVYFADHNTSLPGDYIIIDNWSVEEKPYPTTPCVGTRQPEISTVPMDGMSPIQGTIEGKIYIDDMVKRNSPSDIYVFAIITPSGLIHFKTNNTTWRLVSQVPSVGTTGVNIPISSVPNGLTYFKVYWASGILKAEFWSMTTKTKVAEIVVNNPIIPATFTSLSIMCNNNGAGPLNGIMSDLRLSVNARTNSPDLTKPLGIDRYTVAYYPFSDSIMGEMIDYAIVNNSKKYLNGYRNDNINTSFLGYSGGVVTLSGGSYFDELYVTNREASDEEVLLWAKQGPFFDPSPIVSDDQIGSATKWNAVTTNFNARNDRKATTPANPTIATDGTAVDHVINTDGSADISFEWAYSGSGDAYDIDGFIITVRSSTSNAAYTFGTIPATETTYVIPAEKRAFILGGCAANLYYTFGVQAYRNVDQDINAAGVIKSAIIKPTATGENPYQPSSSVAFAGNITGTVNGVAAATVTTNAANGNTAYSGTANYRTAGVPTNPPSPGTVTVSQNTNGTMNIRIAWGQYTQGANKADFLILFWKSGPAANQGAVNLTDGSIAFNVNVTGTSYYDLEGVAPKYYSLGLAAARRTENGVEIGTIQCPAAWQNVNATSASYNAGNVPITGGSGSVKIDNSGMRTYNGAALQVSVGTDGEIVAGGGSVKVGAAGFRAYVGSNETFRADGNGVVIGSSDGKTKFTGTAWEIRDENNVLRVRIGKLD